LFLNFRSTVEHTTWQSSVQEFRRIVRIEATNSIAVQEETITTITKSTIVSKSLAHQNLSHEIQPS